MPFPFPPDPKMLLRDALRGVADVADATEDALEQAGRMLPEPLRDPILVALRSLERAGRRLVIAPVSLTDLRAAADFVAGRDRSDRAVAETAKVICYAWEHLRDARPHDRLMISESILADSLSRIPVEPAGSEALRAARIVVQTRRSSAIGRMPGVSTQVAPDIGDDNDLRLVSVIVWLMSQRAGEIEAEARLLELALVLCTAYGSEIKDAIAAPDRLAVILDVASSHL